MAPKTEAPKKKVAKPAAKAVEDKKKAVVTKKAAEPKKAATEVKKAPAEPKKAAEEAEPKKGDEEMKDASAEEPKTEETSKEAEAPKELEQDAPALKGATLEAGAISFYTEDTTLNVMPAVGGKILMALGEGGLQYLLAGAKANVGLKAGRYMFETVMAEAKNPAEPKGDNQGPKPRNLVRVGLATADAPLLLADGTQSVCFDSEGNFIFGKEKKKVSQKFGASQVVAVLVNLDKSSPNANTVSLFVDGARACEPQKLPESLQGKLLYPAVTYRNATLQVNFGPSALSSLPFTCNMVAGAVKADCEIKPKPAVTKQEVLLPVCLPDQGGFDWLDKFLAKNKSYIELSDRAIIDWITKSGIPRVKGAGKACADTPEMNYGLPLLDDYSIHKAVWAVAPLMARSYIIMEVRRNLLAEERKLALDFFPSQDFKRSALVVIGEPTADYKSFVSAELLKKKEKKVEEDKKKKKLQKEKEAERQRLLEVKRKKALDAKKAKEAKEKAAAGATKEGEEAAAEEAKEPEEDTGAAKTEEVKEPEVEEEEVKKVELTEEELKTWYLPKPIPDLKQSDYAQFASFCIPTKEDGFDDIRFEWYPQSKACDYLKAYIKDKKLTQKVDSLEPSEWFKTQFSAWQKQLSAWKRKATDYPAKKKAEIAKKKADEAKKKVEETKKKKAEEAKKKKAEEEKKEGEEANGEAAEEEAEEAPEEAVEEAADETMQIDAEDLDVFAIEDIEDVGNGEPLYLKFEYEDWALLSLRFELHLLCHAFRRDLNDPERPAFHESHLNFYYNKYYKKSFSTKAFNCPTVTKLVEFVKDILELNEQNSTLVPDFPDDTPLDNFVKLAEEQRRQRQRRVDMGDETAKLEFPRQASPLPSAAAAPASTPRITPAVTTARIGPATSTAQAGGIKRPYGAVAGPSAYPPATRPRMAYGGGPIVPTGGAYAGGMYGPPAGKGFGAYGAPAAGKGAFSAFSPYSAYRR